MEKYSQVSDLFKKFKNVYIYESPDIQGGRCLFSLLSLADYRVAERISQEFPMLIPDVEEDIWRNHVIEHSFGPNVSDLNAGIVTTVAQLIIKLSGPNGLDGLKEDIEKARNSLQDMRDQLVLKVCEAFPGYDPDQVEELDWPSLAKRVAQAEVILGRNIDFLTEGEVAGELEGELQDGLDLAQVERELREA